MELIRKIEVGQQLYRYDIVKPPEEGWCHTFKSPIYNNYGFDLGPKNEIGAFFFFDDETETKAVAKNVLNKKGCMIRDFNPDMKIWITQTTTTEDLVMLDLSKCNDVVELYVNLWINQIDIFKSNFYSIRQFGSKPMSQIRDNVEFIANHLSEKSSIPYMKHKCQIINFNMEFDDKEQLRFACQELTDFCNGQIFKDLLESKRIDGYIFKESDANTFCIFECEKLSFPKTEIIRLFVE